MAPFLSIVLVCCALLSLLPGSHGFLFNSTSKKGLVIDTFKNSVQNDLGAWHGPGEKLYVRYGNWARRFVRLFPSNPDHNYHTQLSASCLNLTDYSKMYLHVAASGSHHFSISLYQNVNCDVRKPSVPLTADSIDATRYATGTHIYVPLSHFSIDLSKAHSIAFHGFYSPREVVLHKVEIIPSVPRHVRIPRKQKTGTLVFRCKRPNSFAFGVDDGDPELAREVMKIFEDEGIQVTFFVVGKGLEDKYANFTAFYKEMLQRGHQVALHSYSHPKMEGLDIASIDREILQGYRAVRDQLGVKSRYFRPPYGTIGARTRQRLAWYLKDPYIVNWSVDIEDWLWANTDEPEKQLEAFKRDVDRGGDLVVMHYLTPSTVQYFRDVIKIARNTGKRIMRVDQCLMDPDAPPLKASKSEKGQYMKDEEEGGRDEGGEEVEEIEESERDEEDEDEDESSEDDEESDEEED